MYLIEATEEFRDLAEGVCLEDEEFTVEFEGYRLARREILKRGEIKVVVSTYYTDKTKVSKAQQFQWHALY